MATVYHRDQPGAPELVYSPGAQGGFNAFKTIVKACLVEGYTGKAAAGWQLINEGPAFLVLRNGSHSGYICFTFFSSAMRVYLAETYTGMNGDIIAGAGVKSGNAAGSTLPQAVDLRYVAGYTTSSTWMVIADDRTATVAIASNSGSQNAELTGSVSLNSQWTFNFGEDSSGNFICAGGAATTGSAGGNPSLAFDGGFTSLKNPASGLLLGANPLAFYIPAVTSYAASAATAAAAAVAAMPSASLVRIHWQVPGAWAGWFRGLALCPEVSGVTHSSTAAQYLGRPGPMYIRDASQPIDLGDGYTYFARAGHYNSAFWLITDNPEFW